MIVVINFTYIDVKGEYWSKQHNQAVFCLEHSVNSGWNSSQNMILFLRTIMECYSMKCPTPYLLPTNEIDLEHAKSLGFKVIYQINQKFQCILSLMSHIFSPPQKYGQVNLRYYLIGCN